MDGLLAHTILATSWHHQTNQGYHFPKICMVNFDFLSQYYSIIYLNIFGNGKLVTALDITKL